MPRLTFFEAASIGAGKEVDDHLKSKPEVVNSYGVDGFTALGLACFFGHGEIVQTLLTAGADPNLRANNAIGIAPIHSACAVGKYELVKLLIVAGAKVNVAQQRDVTPLHSAAHLGNAQLVQLLLDAGADPRAKMEDGTTPYAMAKAAGFTEVMALLAPDDQA